MRIIMVALAIFVLVGCAASALTKEKIGEHIQSDFGIDSSLLVKGQHCGHSIVTRETKKAYFYDCVVGAYENEVFIYNANPIAGGIKSLHKRMAISDIDALALATSKKQPKEGRGKESNKTCQFLFLFLLQSKYLLLVYFP